MDEILQAIAAALSANGGNITWQQFVDALPEREKARAYNWAKQMESQDVGRRQVVLVDGQPVFSVTNAPVNGGG